MVDKVYQYPAYEMVQVAGSKPLVLFGAPATDISEWAGIPQRGRLDDSETAGFQREENPNRVRELSEFFADSANVVQNPLLCATQDSSAVTFSRNDNSKWAARFWDCLDQVHGIFWVYTKAADRPCSREPRVPSSGPRRTKSESESIG
ncbi:hypothetical protein GOSPT_088_00080 [Gordonia sputi NBRC 100414]|uniref:Uncharacterized protein n=1 Tax=Gordonia sputi NBRC 100414 TaxID=1089453 RepID=H5U2Y6_9ACTN|nr:hypothetical protein GOSPT_088_00080 [Gordonia sputi NBRC 100414]